MKNIKNFYRFYKATFKGELKEKIKRKIFITTGIFRVLNGSKRLTKLKIKNSFFYNSEAKLVEKFDEILIFNNSIKLKKLILDDNRNKKKWYKEKISYYNDIKVTWELNRLQFLLPISLIGNPKKSKEILDEWIAKNPYNKGINWNSNLEVAIRSVSIVNFLSTTSYSIMEEYKDILYLHGRHIYKEISYTEKCIPNNHVIGEAAALYILSHLLEFLGNEKWKIKSKKILEKYLSHLHEDGSYEEASLSYQRFVIQMYVIVLIFSKKYKDNFLEIEILKKLENSCVFLKSIKKQNKDFPDFGDNDEGYFYKINKNLDFDSFLNSLISLFEKNSFKGEIQILEEIHGVVLNNQKIEILEKEYFKEGKYFVCKNSDNYFFIHNQNQKYHSHSDGLSIELVLDKRNILIDSGTFNYNTDLRKRKYYRGTLSHNTVFMDQDQSEQVKSFRWINSCENNLEYTQDENKIIIEGNIKTETNKKHYRKIELMKDFSLIKIKDEISTNNFILNWIFGENVKLIKISNKIFFMKDINYFFIIKASEDVEISLEEVYYSPKYNIEKVTKKIQIKSKKNIKEKIKIETTIKKGNSQDEDRNNIWNKARSY